MMDGIEGNVTPLNVVNAGAGATEGAAAAAESGGKSKMPLLLGSAAAVALLIGAGAFVMLGGDDAPAVASEELATSTQTTSASVAPAVTDPVTAPEPAEEEQVAAADEPVVTEEAPAPVVVEESATAPVVVEEPSVAEAAPSAAETPRPVIVDEPTEPTQTTSGPVVVTGPAATEEQAVPDIRPSVRPDGLAVAAAPVIEEPPLPEPVDTPRPTVVEPEANAALPNQPSLQLTADAATPEVALPDVPAEVAAVGTGPAVEEIVAVVPGNELTPTVVETSWSVELPFAADRDGSNVIGQVGFISPVWVKPGLAITSVNGTPVDAINEIPAALRQNPSLGEADQIEVEFGTIDLTNGAEADYSWTLPVVQETELLNGLRFESVFTGTEWRTSVAEVPASLTGDLQVGDVLKGFISGEDVIDGRNTLANIVERELSEGNQQFIFDVLRGNDRWVAMFNYAGN